MAWDDNLQEAAYNSPSGIRTVFAYEDVSYEQGLKTSAYEFADADGTYVQKSGNTGMRLPLRMFIWGETYDDDAKVFEDSLKESGIGRLEHPEYGTIDVVPFGTLKRNDALKTEANQAVFDITFWQTIGVAYPTAQTAPAEEVTAKVDEYNETVSEQFENDLDIDTQSKKNLFAAAHKAVLSTVKSGLDTIASASDAVKKQFDAIDDSINNGISVLVGDPLTLASQTAIMVQAPARSVALISDRLDAYENLLGDVVESFASSASDLNSFLSNDLFAGSLVTGSIVAVVNNEFETKTSALEAAEQITDMFDSFVEWRDTNFETVGKDDTGEAYQKLQEAVALAAGYLVEISFTLKQTRSIVLDRDRGIIDLCAELYGKVDGKLDFFITSNSINGSEMFFGIPMGREIEYYV